MMRYYLSHSIRGKHGVFATLDQMEANCDRVIVVANKIREALPSVDLYVPAEHEDFVHIAFTDGYLNEQQVLEIDCKIIDNCDGVIIFSPPDDKIQGGRAVERDHAIATNIPVMAFSHEREAIKWLTYEIMRS